MYVRHWIVEGKYLGWAEAKKRRVHEIMAPPIGYHFFCRHCGRLWAQCPVDNEKHMVWTMPCADHAPSELDAFDIAGSLQMEWDKQFTAEMPEKVIQWELAVHLRWGALSNKFPAHIASICSSMLPYFSAAK